MKHYFKFLLLGTILCCNVESNAQNQCAVTGGAEPFGQRGLTCTGNSTADYYNKYAKLQNYIPDANMPVKTIKVALHFFQNSAGGNMWADNAATRNAFIATFNAINNNKSNVMAPSWPISGVLHITDAKIRYEIVDFYFYQSNTLNNEVLPWNFESAVAAVDPSRLDALPIFYTAGIRTDSASGLAIFPTTNLAQNSYVVMYNKGLYGTGEGTLDHELGHCLDLRHTYDDDVQYQLDPEYLSDVFGVSWGSYCSPTPGYTCYHQGSWNWDPNDHVLHPYATNNLMGGCLYSAYLSPKQMGKVHRALGLKNMRKYVKEMTSESAYPWLVTSNETWDFDIQMYEDIVVKAGNTLTIKCRLGMANNGRIIVERGARLIIDGGEVYAWGTSWEGIQVWGNSSQRQAIGSNGLSVHHGIVKVINGGTLRDAKNAIVTIKQDAAGNIDWGGYFGGIVQCDDANFINNRVSVAFMSHDNYVGTLLVPNLSYIYRSVFEVNNDMAAKDPSDPYLNTFVSLWGVEGVRLMGNVYQNVCNPLPPINHRGYGVVSSDGRFTIDRYRICSSWGTGGCASYSTDLESKFENLFYGVNIQEYSPLMTTTVANTDFRNCNRSIYMLGTYNTRITGNRIEMPAGGNTPSTLPYGIYSDWSTAYDISNNEIIDSNSMSANTTGIFIHNTGGFSNMLYRNSASNVYSGLTVAGDNRGFSPGQGLQLRCNQFGQVGQNHRDIFLRDQSLTYGGTAGKIDMMQGNNSVGANNRFSHNSLSGFGDYWDQSYSTIAYFYNPELSGATTPYYYNTSLQPHQLVAADWNLVCPVYRQTISSGTGLHNKLVALQSFDNEIISLQEQVDDNNTQWFLDAINGVTSVPVNDLKTALVNASPYLSDEVLTACFTTLPLTNNNIVNLHRLNAPVTPSVWEVIIGMGLLSSVMSSIEANQFTEKASERKKLEASIADFEQQRAFELNDGVIAQLNDTSGYVPDSILPLVIAGRHEGMNNRLAAFYVATNQVDEAEDLFYIIRTETNEELNDFCLLQEMILGLKQEERGVFTLRTNEILRGEVEDMAEADDEAGAHARALLRLVMGTAFEEDVTVPEDPESPAPKPGSQQENLGNEEASGTSMLLYPNPSGGNISVAYVLPEEYGSAELLVFDISGNEVIRQSVSGGEAEATLLTEKLRSGLYFVDLMVDGRQLQSSKLIKK